MKASTIITLVSLGVAAAGTIYSIVSGQRYKKLCKKLNKSIDELYDKDIEIDISDDIINEVIDRKIEAKLDASVHRVEQIVANSFRMQLEKQVKREIGAQYTDIKSDVKREIKEQIGRIDINEARKEVIADAKDEAARLFRDEYRYRMDEMVEGASEEIKDVVKRARTDIAHISDIHEMLSDFKRNK